MNKTTVFNKIGITLTTLAVIFSQIQPAFVQAADPRIAKVSFTFDDGLASAMTQAAPTLQKYSLTGTNYVITSCVGMTKTPNTCHADTNKSYMTWDQLKTLQNTYGWEIGSHTATHPYLASSDAGDGQPNKLTATQVAQELSKSKSDLTSHGFNVTDFASPYGDYSYPILAEVAKQYASHRGFWDQNTNTYPYNDYILSVKQVQAGVSVTDVKTAIDQAIANKQWLILVFHDIKTKPSNKVDDYEYSTTNLDQIANYVKSKQSAGVIQSVKINQGLAVDKTNILPNNTFSDGLGEGWTTNNSSTVTKDTGTNGSFPSPKESMLFAGNGKANYLFTPAIPAVTNATYSFKAFVNTLSQSGGEFGYYIDEYDANGNWISGKWLGAVWLPTVSYFTGSYTPSSAAVSTFKIQTYFSGNSAGKVYTDNFQLYNLTTTQGTVVPTPTPSATATPAPTVTSTPVPTATVAPTATVTLTVTVTVPPSVPSATTTPTPTASPSANLVLNGSFEQVTNDFGTDWVKNSSNFSIDTTAKGNDGTNSLHLTPNNTSNAHVFSARIAVDSATTYRWSQFIKTESAAGEFGFYIDEYDSNGNWISGQWKGMISGAINGTTQVSYTPTSSQVKSINLQYYVVANSAFDLFIDSVFFGK
jgi:peptidoglycan/xylan/chitin deacetylase (PgdA/CDA1 family)